MIIEYSNAQEMKTHAGLSAAIIIASSLFFFIPTTLIVLGYLTSQPTGTLISPLPQGTLSQSLSPSPAPDATQEAPLIAAPNEASPASANLSPSAASNIIDKTASVSAGLLEVSVTDPDIKSASQIYLSPRTGDSSVYSVKSKSAGQMVLTVNSLSDTVRYVDYHIVNP